ncbi:MAG: TrkH family potassium uptake protein [Lachnospiraceae bacterium]|nr:TrkH family potassium uptake protein [Lachnospiraceae bacterium]
MNLRIVLFYLGRVLGVGAISMVIPLILSLAFGDGSWPHILTAIIIAGVPALALSSRKLRKGNLFAREGYVITALGWILLSMIGALPFYMSGTIPSYIDAVFEVVSGFTTTGSTILTEVEHLGPSLLFWRSFTHWLGGMGVLVLILAILPMSGDSYHMNIMKAESAGPNVSKLVPRLRDTAISLYAIYFVMTILCAASLMLSGMKVLDAFCISFATAGTGGFCILNTGMNTYSTLSQALTTIWMILFGVSFTIYFLMIGKDWKSILKNEELRTYLGIIVVSAVLISFNVFLNSDSELGYFATLHHSFFTVGSIMTTTGFATLDFDLWPQFSKMILLTLMFIGACAGSTGGGIKVARLIILFKQAKKEIHLLFHPKAVRQVQLEGKTVEHSVIRSVNNYMIIYVMVFVASLLIVSLDKFDFATNFSAVAATMNNIGPGFSAVGPYGSYAGFTKISKIVLTADMLAGRLEILPILMLFHKNTWSRHF